MPSCPAVVVQQLPRQATRQKALHPSAQAARPATLGPCCSCIPPHGEVDIHQSLPRPSHMPRAAATRAPSCVAAGACSLRCHRRRTLQLLLQHTPQASPSRAASRCCDHGRRELPAGRYEQGAAAGRSSSIGGSGAAGAGAAAAAAQGVHAAPEGVGAAIALPERCLVPRAGVAAGGGTCRTVYTTCKTEVS